VNEGIDTRGSALLHYPNRRDEI